jgi:hypothetical protein
MTAAYHYDIKTPVEIHSALLSNIGNCSGTPGRCIA